MLLGAAPASAKRVHEPAPEGFVRLLSPAPGSVWVAGEPLLLSWDPGPAFAGAAGIEEWEAFLSLDDGATWAVRLTPHLDVGLRRFEVPLPPWAAPRARLLLRFGDERRELEVEAPGPIRIGPARDAAALPARRAWSAGEPARSGAEGTLLWLEGGRSGAALARFEADAPMPGLASTRPGRPPALMPPAAESGRSLSLSPPHGEREPAPPSGSAAGPPGSISTPEPLSPRLAGCRWNC